MNVLVVHNKYRERGGEDRVVELESALLARHGHTVVPYIADNRDLDARSKAALPFLTIWNRQTVSDVRQVIARERIDLVHVHNTLPLVSPSVYHAARAAGVPVVQTLHNFRLLCPNAACFRDGAPCVQCVGAALPLAGVAHGCYRQSRAAAAAVTAMLVVHRLAGTWRRAIDRFIAPSEFVRRLFVSGGLPAERISVKPHFVDPDRGIKPGQGGYVAFVGRLSDEKGIPTLLEAWSRLRVPVPLKIAGDGPLRPLVERAVRTRGDTEWLGRLERAEVERLIGDAAVLIVPSGFYETFGQVIAEAYAAGTPVIASAHGAAAELVFHGRTGLLFRPGDADDLTSCVERFMRDPSEHARMRAAARVEYETRYTADANYRALINIYSAVIGRDRQAAA